MQATTVIPAPPPQPAAPAPAPVTVTFTGVDGATQVLTVPTTKEALRALKSQRSAISDQLSNVTNRRSRVADELAKTTDAAARSGLEQRLVVLDKRIAQMESDLASTGRQLSAAPPNLTSGTENPVNGDIPQNVMTLTSVFTVFVLFPISVAIARLIWKKTTSISSRQTVQISPNIDQRLERLEQGVDAIAIEIERVTEGQRFVTKLLSEQESRVKLPG